MPDRYPLGETATTAYEERTERNVRESDATLILNEGTLEGGTLLTAELARNLGRPHLVVALDGEADAALVRAWLESAGPSVLNVAGPRESKVPGIHERARDFLCRVLGANADS